MGTGFNCLINYSLFQKFELLRNDEFNINFNLLCSSSFFLSFFLAELFLGQIEWKEMLPSLCKGPVHCSGSQ